MPTQTQLASETRAAGPQGAARVFSAIARAFAGSASGAGAALWLAPGEQPDEATMVQMLSDTLSGHHAEEVFAVVEQMGVFYPVEPVWYLPSSASNPRNRAEDTARRC